MKKTILLLIFCVVLLCCLVLFIPTLRWHILNKPQKTSTLLLNAQHAVCWYGDTSQELTKKQIKELTAYAATLMEEQEEGKSVLNNVAQQEFVESRFAFYVKFQFSHAYSYQNNETAEPLVFDSLLLSSYHNAVTLWLGLEDTYYACVNLETFSAGKVLKRAESMVLGTLLQNKGETINTVAAVSSAFPAVPSSVTIYHGEATTLVGEEASTVYQLVANMVEHSTALADRGQFGYGTVFEKLSGEYVIMELRYEQRQQYKNDAVMAASDTLTDDELFAVKASMTDGFTYDSVVFAISVKNNCIYMLPPFACIDGVYQVPSGSGTMMEWACSDQAIVSSIKEYCQ